MADVQTSIKTADPRTLSDPEIVRRVLDGERELFEILMRRHNQRLYRVARSVLNNDTEAEDVLQESYVRAFTKLEQFQGKSQLSTWLSKIVLYEALARLRKKRRIVDAGALVDLEAKMGTPAQNETPQDTVLRAEATKVMEDAINSLPRKYRAVVVMREVEGLNISETAENLGLTEQTVKTRLFRAHSMLRKQIGKELGSNMSQVYSFMNERCDRLVEKVMSRIRTL
jgi:RNA polymerase sigma-70 factor, ECF subfamily